MTNRRYTVRGGMIAGVTLAGMIWFAPAQTPKQRDAAPQQMLDFLARPAPVSGAFALPPTYPKHYADWTETQRKSGFQLLAQHCRLMNALEHDNPAARILPVPMTMAEEAELAVSVCIPAKMPADWPERPRYLEHARKLISTADAYGARLHLPAAL